MSKMWKSMPLPTSIIETLKRTGPCTDEELLRNIRKDYDDISDATLNRVLLQLEVRGLIRVATIAKGRKKIEIVSPRTAG
jgi:Fe2+ or Zn2+ uptake regulation protein